MQNVGGRAMRAPTTLRKAATVRCVCNAGLYHRNGWMYLKPSVAPPYIVGARIARPFRILPHPLIWTVITTMFRAGARRVIGATAKPLYAIDGKAGGLDRRSPHTSLIEGGGPPAAVEGVSAQCLPIIYPFVSICDSNKYIETIVNPCFSKNIICLMCVEHMVHMKHMKFTP